LNTILGAVFYRNFFVEFDLENTKVGIAPSNGNMWNGGNGTNHSRHSGGTIPNTNPQNHNQRDSDDGGMSTFGVLFLISFIVGTGLLIAYYSWLRCDCGQKKNQN
jgi:hypothetical protein